MVVQDIYSKFQIPKHLQLHMLRVAAVGQLIGSNFIGSVNVKDITDTLLLHDLGNLLKFDLSKGVELFEEDERNLAYWYGVLETMKSTYSDDEHQATQMMAQKVGVSDRVMFLLSNMGSSNLHKTVEMDDWELKIVSYSDFRVGPHGFLSVEDRFKDILVRYEGRTHELAHKEKTIMKKNNCLLLEEQIQRQVKIQLKNLPEKTLQASVIELSRWSI